jgi:hypothetical protein
MRRAASLLVLVAALLPLLPTPGVAGSVERAPSVIDGSGFVNFMQRPHFTIGEWVKYRTVGHSLRGFNDDYTVTIMVAGEEVFWGDPCVWIETWTQPADGKLNATASLVSYAAFGDTMSDRHLMWFVRKTINGITAEGKPDASLVTRGGKELKIRAANWAKDENPIKTDSLGTDTTSVPGGGFDVKKVKREFTHAETAEQGDSTVYYDRRTTRIFYYTPKIPITNLAKITIEDEQRGKTWLVGKFNKNPYNILERADGTTQLIAIGKDGLTPKLVPAAQRRPISRKLIEEALSMPQSAPAVAVPRKTGGQ